MKTALLISLGLILISQSVSCQQPVEVLKTFIDGKNITQSIYYYTQVLDHFNINDRRTWQQRYAIYSDEYNPVNGTVFVYIGGEGKQKGLSPGLGWMVELAKKFSALFLIVEHRFYGASQPFGKDENSYSNDNLAYLSVDQALEDLAQIIANFKTLKLHGLSENVPFITIGGSYPGAVSAWFRSKYPHLVVGALAASAVILPIEDFQQYDYQIYLSTLRSGQWCPQNIQAFNQQLEQILVNDREQAEKIIQQFNATNLRQDEFLSFFGDLYSGLVQYGRRSLLCSFFAQNTTFSDQLNSIYQYAIVQGNQPIEAYDTYTLTNTTYDEDAAGRQWTWQTCTEFGWFQTANQVQPMRSKQVDLDFYRYICNVAFDGEHNDPDITANVNRFGGLKIGATNIVFTNGIEDEWQWASLRQSTPQLTSIFNNCDNCAHCQEFRTPRPTDPPGLQSTRKQVEAIFAQWIHQFYLERQSFGKRMLRGVN
ncbi:hypothetical protein ABPG74_001785 [Tetrahymena malaccensis]